MTPLLSNAGSLDFTQILTRGHTLPCSTAAHAFSQIVQPSNRFQLALDALLPILESPRSELSHRILVTYILYSMYAPHPIRLNPFRSALYDTFVEERKFAIDNPNPDGASDREQLVWVLWKVLRGDGQDLGPFSPSQFVRSALPSKLRASNLLLDEGAAEDDFAALVPTHVEEPASDALVPPAPVSAETDAQTRALSQAMTLLLAARDRVLTLSELRILNPLIPELTSPPVITSFDLPPLIAHNPTLAYPLLVTLIAHGPGLYFDMLAQLPPTLPTFDVLGRLLRDVTPVHEPAGGTSTVADVTRAEVLGRFIIGCIGWLDEAEVQEREGFVSDDRFSQGVRNLCRFYTSLINLGIINPTVDTDSVEMITFTLRQARFEEANTLYRILVASRL
ncbi:hypothetical protein K488DRAFT_48530 [Vararia minispora EC-137]|uniref:Uncharacterized protein n=1 Tax=Vararia minispora EC-137 TaxID=1314806 RepID=A0ACB8QNC4_9AGAM|nr:hypothetical protein K488DRAFT_48530 [Vararia minispora EC-137]